MDGCYEKSKIKDPKRPIRGSSTRTYSVECNDFVCFFILAIGALWSQIDPPSSISPTKTQKNIYGEFKMHGIKRRASITNSQFCARVNMHRKWENSCAQCTNSRTHGNSCKMNMSLCLVDSITVSNIVIVWCACSKC